MQGKVFQKKSYLRMQEKCFTKQNMFQVMMIFTSSKVFIFRPTAHVYCQMRTQIKYDISRVISFL